MTHLIVRTVCVVALLFGQCAALMHAISHAAHIPAKTRAPALAQPCGEENAPAYAELCALDPAFSSLFGIAHATRPAPVQFAGRFMRPIRHVPAPAGVRPLTSLARGPPTAPLA